MLSKSNILQLLQQCKPKYENEGLKLVGLFGSYATDNQNNFSDVDIAYTIDYDKFSQKYKDGFSKLIRIEDVKNELQDTFKTKVDLVPTNNKQLFKDIIYV